MSILQQIFKNDWAGLLQGQEEELLKIGNIVAEKRKETSVFPYSNEVFRAFNETPFGKLKVVLLGYDPYPNRYKGEPVACGLSFAPRNPEYLPPSLRIIKKSMEEDLLQGQPGDLNWFDLPKQGVLLLNAALTVEEGKSGSHLKLWENFTSGVLRTIQYNNTGLVFILLGKDANNFRPHINEAFNYVISRSHPASSVYSGSLWKHDKLWSECNKIIYGQTREKINWITPK